MSTDSKSRIVVGMGVTGLSCARHFVRKGLPFTMVDSRNKPPGVDSFRDEFPDTPLHLGSLPEQLFVDADELFVSPGIALDKPEIASALQCGTSVSGDIDLFSDDATAPIAAITGSNAKSTVTTLVGNMAIKSGLNTGVGGNLGHAALDLLDLDRQLYVLELSSFQLERCSRLSAEVACILNISEDHLDHHRDMQAYIEAKQLVYRNARCVVYNRADLLTAPSSPGGARAVSFGLDAADDGHWGTVGSGSERCIALGQQSVLPVNTLKLRGEHNVLNTVAAFAIGQQLGLDSGAMCDAATEFSGLPHRCEFVAEVGGVAYINDSKATNVGACIAALQGLQSSNESSLVLIAGGQGKGADFTPLAKAIADMTSAVVLIGEDAEQIAKNLPADTHVYRAANLSEAIEQASKIAQPGDTVLFSPACASFDMFANFEQRGEQFCLQVNALDDRGGSHD